MSPLIGITLDSEEPPPGGGGGYSAFPWYAVRQNYCAAVAAAGGLPVTLPHEPQMAAAYLERIDGLLVTGGHFDVDPGMYGDTDTHDTVRLKQKRTAFERAMVEGALAANMPVLGICGGQQLLHVLLGGTLIQHIPDEVPDALAHEQTNPRDEPGHMVSIVGGTLLHDIVQTDEMAVNSAHHQAAKDIAGGITVNATAPDGIVEGIEHGAHCFCLGVQWHPEFFISEGDRRIFNAFVKAAG